MKKYAKYRLLIAMLTGLLIFPTGCQREEEDLRPATFPNTAEIFINEFSAGLEYAAYGDSKVTAFAVDEQVSFEGLLGSSSMRFDVPNLEDPEGSYAGGIFRDLGGRDLSGYDALTFYAYASKAATIETGFGTDFRTDAYVANTFFKLNTSWTKYIIPIPDPSKLTQMLGLFSIAAAPDDNGDGYTIWIDQVKFEKLGTLARPRPEILFGEEVNQKTFIGLKATLSGLLQTTNLPNGADQTVFVAPSYFAFTSSDTTVAKVDPLGNVSVVGVGTTVITGSLAGSDAAGSLTLESLGEFTPAPIPDRDAQEVISIFSDAYVDVNVDFYNGFFAPFQTTLGGADLVINDDKIIRYTQLNFVATEFKNPTVNASEMTHFHVDIQVEDDLDPGDFIRVQLTDFGPDGAFGGDEDSDGSVTFNSPPLETGQWASLDIPLADFSGLTSTMNLAQIFFISDATISNILVDNMYFYKEGGGGGDPILPTVPAPTPTEAEADVISIYSDAYTDVPNTGFNLYGAAAFEEVDLSGNGALKYTFVEGENGNFQVIELGEGNQIDAEAAGMTNFRFDVWFPNAVDGNSAFLMKLVDRPASGATEALINVGSTSNPMMSQGSWLQFDIPFTELESNGLGGKSNIQQLVIDLVNSGEVYIDNIYFYKPGGGNGSNAPTDAPPAPPTRDAADVVSIYGEAYGEAIGLNNVPWDDPSAFTEENIASNNVLKVGFGSGFLGTDLGSVADASDMTHFHMDFWISDDFEAGQVFNPKWSNHAGGAGETSAFELTRGIGDGDVQKWVSIDVPITDFSTGDNTQRAELAQFLISVASTIDTAYVDNIYFYKDGGGNGSNAPTDAPPAPPARDAADVVSIYGEAYGEAIGLSNVPWDDPSAFTEENIAGNNVLKVEFGGGFIGTDLNSVADASDMTHFHMDFWISDDFAAGQVFNPKWSNHAGGGGETSAFELTNAIGGEDVQKWMSIDVPITDFTIGDNTQRAELAQFLISVAGTIDLAYIDNIYFYK